MWSILFSLNCLTKRCSMEELLKIVSAVNDYLSDYVLILLLAGSGIYFTVRTKFVQIRCFREGFRNAFGKIKRDANDPKRGTSAFQALTAAVAAQVGTGNIVGASGAILTGGPGAIFWMWIIAFFGMATVYAEAVLAQETRVIDSDGTIHGGPVYYIKKAFPNVFGKILAVFFAVAIIVALGFMGSMVQSNSIGETCFHAFGIPTWITGLLLALLACGVFLGGADKLVRVTEKLVPIMALLYLTGGLFVLVSRYQYVPETFVLIFRYAFEPQALLGGGIGHALKTALSQGAKRGLFSNEAGMGSTPHAHAIARVNNPHEQGTVAMVGVFLDTMVVLTMTAFIIISTLYTGSGPLANANGKTYAVLLKTFDLTQTNLVQKSVGSVSSASFGNIFVAVCLMFFAFSTILSWNYFGKINFHYLFGKKAILIYIGISLCAVVLGTLVKSDLVWGLQDMFNQLMVLPNILALFALTSLVRKHAVNTR